MSQRPGRLGLAFSTWQGCAVLWSCPKIVHCVGVCNSGLQVLGKITVKLAYVFSNVCYRWPFFHCSICLERGKSEISCLCLEPVFCCVRVIIPGVCVSVVSSHRHFLSLWVGVVPAAVAAGASLTGGLELPIRIGHIPCLRPLPGAFLFLPVLRGLRVFGE